MPRRNSARVPGFTLAGMRVLGLETGVLPRNIEGEREIDWPETLGAWGFSLAERQLGVMQLEGHSVKESAGLLGIDSREAERRRKSISRRINKLKCAAAVVISSDVGDSMRLSFTEEIWPGRRIWTLRKLDPAFVEIMAHERKTFFPEIVQRSGF